MHHMTGQKIFPPIRDHQDPTKNLSSGHYNKYKYVWDKCLEAVTFQKSTNTL